MAIDAFYQEQILIEKNEKLENVVLSIHVWQHLISSGLLGDIY